MGIQKPEANKVSAGKSKQLVRVRISALCHLTARQKSHTQAIERASYNAIVTGQLRQ